MHKMGFWGFYQAQGSNLGSNPKLSGWSPIYIFIGIYASHGMTPNFSYKATMVTCKRATLNNCHRSLVKSSKISHVKS